MKYFFAEWTRRAFEDIQHKQFKATVSAAKAEIFFLLLHWRNKKEFYLPQVLNRAPYVV